MNCISIIAVPAVFALVFEFLADRT